MSYKILHNIYKISKSLKICVFSSKVVWKRSTEFGIAKAIGRSGKLYVVATYNWGGNDLNQWRQNVMQLRPAPSNDWEETEDSFDEHEQHGLYEDTEFNEWEREGLTVHNQYRNKHGAPPLKLNRQVKVFRILLQFFF